MTDNATLFVDLSSNNGPADLAKHYKAGYRTLALKATEGTAYTWTEHGAMADRWHELGGNVWHYHFARPGDGKAQAKCFLAAVAGHWKDGDRLALDVEVPGVTVELAHLFITVCYQTQPTRHGLVYSYASFLTEAGITPLYGWGLWLADYTSKKRPKPVKGWDRVDAWQHTRTASGVPGMSGSVDQSFLFPEVPPVKPTRLAVATRVALRLVARNLRGRHVPVIGKDQAVLTAADQQIQRVRNLKEKP